MASKSEIEWCDATWSPVRAKVKANAAEIAAAKGYASLIQIATDMAGHVGPHCEHCSPGCENCYSDTNNSRCLPHNGTGLPFDRRSRDLVDIFLDAKILNHPLHWRRPRNIFVCSQTDLFADFVPFEMIDEVFTTMIAADWHTYQILTKRADRMLEYFLSGRHDGGNGPDRANYHLDGNKIWLGVSIENQKYADERIPLLLQTPAAVRFVSYEPALEAVRFTPYTVCIECAHATDPPDPCRNVKLDWLIVGGESGPGARPFNIDWARQVIADCKHPGSGTAVFYKQGGASNACPHDRKGGHFDCFPEDLKVREFPHA